MEKAASTSLAMCPPDTFTFEDPLQRFLNVVKGKSLSVQAAVLFRFWTTDRLVAGPSGQPCQ